MRTPESKIRYWRGFGEPIGLFSMRTWCTGSSPGLNDDGIRKAHLPNIGSWRTHDRVDCISNSRIPTSLDASRFIGRQPFSESGEVAFRFVELVRDSR